MIKEEINIFMAEFIVADLQELTSFALEALLKEDTGNSNIAHAEDKTELILLLKQQPECIILLDYTLFDFTDVENLLIVSERFPQTLWILISDDLTDIFLRKVIYSSHRISIIFKDSPLKIIQEAIQAAISGHRYICQRATEIILDQNQKEETPTTLTPTEIEILKSIAQGKTTKDIATERFCSIHTINTHRKNIFRKLGVNTAHEAIKYAFRAGLVDTSEFYI